MVRRHENSSFGAAYAFPGGVVDPEDRLIHEYCEGLSAEEANARLGVPLTVGFVSKWYLVMGAFEAGLWPVAVLILLSSLLAVVYIWRVVEVAYFREPPEEAPEVQEAPFSLLAPTWVLIGATVVFGIFTSLSVGVASAAARMLLGIEL